MDDAKAEDFKQNAIFAKWDYHGGELVRSGYNVVKVMTFKCLRMPAQTNTSFLVWLVRSSRAQDLAQGSRHSRRRRCTPHEPRKLLILL